MHARKVIRNMGEKAACGHAREVEWTDMLDFFFEGWQRHAR
jgi:hypothetical protein